MSLISTHGDEIQDGGVFDNNGGCQRYTTMEHAALLQTNSGGYLVQVEEY